MVTGDKRFWKLSRKGVTRSRRPGFGAATPPRSARGNLGRAGIKFPGRTGPDHPSILHDVTEIGDSQSGVCILFHHEDRQTALPQFVNLLEDLGDELWSEPQARFVEHQ